ncbi:hypothetical protein [Shinella sp. BYT-45]|uniref:hypothetical protein n=1 Tax=Shinella sp. BYT-45 TaxID=3377377 RepID=UPI00397EBD99
MNRSTLPLDGACRCGRVQIRISAPQMLTMFEDTGWYSPFVETYTSEKLAWAVTPAVHRYEKFPPMEDYENSSPPMPRMPPEPSPSSHLLSSS